MYEKDLWSAILASGIPFSRKFGSLLIDYDVSAQHTTRRQSELNALTAQNQGMSFFKSILTLFEERLDIANRRRVGWNRATTFLFPIFFILFISALTGVFVPYLPAGMLFTFVFICPLLWSLSWLALIFGRVVYPEEIAGLFQISKELEFWIRVYVR